MRETILTNARLVLPDEVMEGTLVLRGGIIAEIQPGRSRLPSAEDLEGDHLIPGIVDLHTDNLERQVLPRAHARWPSLSAMLAHDAQTAAAGTTTVFDALCLGDLGFDTERIETFRNGVADLDALSGSGLLKAEHFLHLRCELPAADMPALFETVADHPLLRFVSLMDHSPGVGQYADLDRYRRMRARSGMPPEEIEARIAALLDQRGRLRGPNRRYLLDRLSARGIPVASHDDWNEEEIAENARDGITISEFPVSVVAARAARAHGMEIIGGAPNLVRGGSHSGNVAVAELVAAGLVDAFASDYVPPAPLEAAWKAWREQGVALPAAVAMITDRPARMAGLADRGRLAPGLRGDVVRVAAFGGTPVARQVWRAGQRVI
ncbi:MAG: alpha-D-ribose 1-methylphosphonate 5-triphosphate diphosphatase [Acetobacteraceae bacterium]|nr:alpha-D-ribose 1-methylphosphonate 5-triphosphate diphosphatase [Acetobacteraceae bacterium]MCX7685265.1 alpha-D-ribose 1-methylphosphonate 5-triphosphate diphosphatase [Acetobacteraceae bacterium]MDW8397030.1 alpha-D-ribose 1-methylphosphonate 5-triphosphate diphosphatase [Acetobacteraceae bacterium]